MRLDATSNRHGVPLEQATDADTEGWWLVDLDYDYTEQAVAEAMKDAPKGAIPRVRLDPKYKPRRASLAVPSDEPSDPDAEAAEGDGNGNP